MNILNKLPLFFILFFLIYFTSMLPPAHCAAPLVYAASELYLPEKPTPPQQPLSPKNNEKKQAVEQKPPIQPPVQKSPFTKPVEPPPAKQPISDNKPVATEQPTNVPPAPASNFSLPNDSNDNNDPAESATKSAPLKKSVDTFFSAFLNYTIYSILILAIIACTGYLYFTTPQDKPKQKQGPSPKKPSSQLSSPSTITVKSPTTAPSDPLLSNIKITNRSLLEQLVKYDLETYGEIRTNLDYEQPAYVEKLIRKYGGPDQHTVNRAIQLFYQNRKQK